MSSTNRLRNVSATKERKNLSRRLTHFANDDMLLELYRRDNGALIFRQRMRKSAAEKDLVRTRVLQDNVVPLVDDLITGGALLIPPTPKNEPQDATKLFEGVRSHLNRHASWSNKFLTGATAFVMATWVYERFQFFPYLQFIGPPGCGKTRSIEVLASVCYHSYKLSSATPAVVFRVVARYNPTLLIDEMDSELHSDLRIVLREGSSRGGQVTRCSGEDFEPRCFPCYGPKVYAGQEPIIDAALASRVIQENMANCAPAKHIRPTLPKEFERKAQDLRARLFRWQLDNYWNVEEHDPGGDDLRQRQVFLPLFSVTPPEYQEQLHALMDRHRIATRRSASETLEGDVVTALVGMGMPTEIRPIRVAKAVSEVRGVDFFKDVRNPDRVTPERVGRVLKRLGITDSRRDSSGKLYMASPTLLERLRKDYASDLVPTDQSSECPPADSDAKHCKGEPADEYANWPTKESEPVVSDWKPDEQGLPPRGEKV